MAAALLQVALAGPSVAQARNRLSVLPFPGTPDASPSSEIVFTAQTPSELRSVSVVGASSGSHAGRLSRLPDGAGTAFSPDRPFTPGEVVRVRAVLRGPGTRGHRAARTLAWTFTVAVRDRRATAGTAGRALAASTGANQSFRSRPSLHPPDVDLSEDRDPDAGDIFLTSEHSEQPGPMILDGRGRLVWFDPRRQTPFNLEVQRYRGRRVLTWWQGRFLGRAEDVIMSQSYRTVAVVHAGRGYFPDLHEFRITPHGTALIDIYSPVAANLSSVGGPSRGTVMDCIVEKVDIKSGRVLWEWHALGHVPLSAAYTKVPVNTSPYDYFHINSIQQLPNGNFLVSSRSDWALYEISHRTGDVLWKLGGKNSSFQMAPGTNFEWQHDAHLYPDGILSLFDDAGSPDREPQSSAKLLSVNTQTMTVSLLRRYTHSPSLRASLAGSMQLLRNHNVFVGWGSVPAFSEYTPGGRLLLDGRLPLGTYSYRAYRFDWVGRPRTRPALAVSAHDVLYASWNGATQVAFWQPRGGPSPGALRPIGHRVPWRGFETRIRAHGRARYYAVSALNARGRVIATSPVKSPPSGG